MTKYGSLLAIAALARSARKAAASHGVEIKIECNGLGDARGDADRLHSMYAASDSQFQEAVSRSMALGEFRSFPPFNPAKRGKA